MILKFQHPTKIMDTFTKWKDTVIRVYSLLFFKSRKNVYCNFKICIFAFFVYVKFVFKHSMNMKKHSFLNRKNGAGS